MWKLVASAIIVNKILFKEDSKEGISILVDNDPQGYKVSCYVSFGLGFLVLFRLPLAMLWIYMYTPFLWLSEELMLLELAMPNHS